MTAEIEDTLVAVPVARTPTQNSVSEIELMDSEALPLLTHPDVGMLISAQPVRDRLDTQHWPRDLHLIAIIQHKSNGKHDHISTEQLPPALYWPVQIAQADSDRLQSICLRSEKFES